MTARTFLFWPESAYGPTNNCIGIAHELQSRGHRIVFATEASWEGKLAAYGFEERLVDLEPPSETAGDEAGQFWKDYIRDTAPEFRKSTTEQLSTVTRPIYEALIDGAKYCESRLREIIATEQPDVVVQDNVVAFPALVTAPAPFARIVSCHPAEIPGPGVPPALSGLPTAEPERWEGFLRERERVLRPLWEGFNAWVQEQGAPALPEMEFLHRGDLNLYLYPAELDYVDTRPLDPSWHRIDSCVRETERATSLPEGFGSGARPLIYFSLGSLGSADVALMNRVLSVLATLDADVVVSKGPLHTEIELFDNMVGAEFLPQTTLLSGVDLVITHGGNNTVTESLHFGKPMLVLPLFWDQYDNAQRVAERGFGQRLDTYGFSTSDLEKAIRDTLADTALLERCQTAGERIRKADGIRRAADLLEKASLT